MNKEYNAKVTVSIFSLLLIINLYLQLSSFWRLNRTAIEMGEIKDVPVSSTQWQLDNLKAKEKSLLLIICPLPRTTFWPRMSSVGKLASAEVRKNAAKMPHGANNTKADGASAEPRLTAINQVERQEESFHLIY